MKTLPTLVEKENELFDFIQVFNEKQYEEMYKDYKKLKKKEKEEYIQDAIDNGIYIHQPPMWETMPIFYRCQNVLKKFPYIKQDDVYIKKWGREIKVLCKYFIGDMYLLKLKQSDRRGSTLGARNTTLIAGKSHVDNQQPRLIKLVRFNDYRKEITINRVEYSIWKWVALIISDDIVYSL